MTPITILQLAATPWTLTAPDVEVTLSARKACIAGVCAATGSPKLEEDGTWLFDSGVRVRWTSHNTAEVSLDGTAWSPGGLTFATAADAPPSGLTVLGTAHASPSPGRWSQETVACDRSKPVWVFAPIARDQPSVAAYPATPSWSVRTGVTVVMCSDDAGQYGGVH
jgi:hypothetical protein